MSRALARCVCGRVLIEAAEPHEGEPVVRAAGLLLRPGPGPSFDRSERPEDYLPAMLSHFRAGERSTVYCSRCRREVELDHDELHRVARSRRRADQLTLTPGTAR